MSELVVAALKVAFLIVMWAFVLFCANVIRADMFGRTVSRSSDERTLAAVKAAAPTRGRRGKAKQQSAATQPTRLTVVEGRQVGLSVRLSGVVGLGRAADSALNLDDDYASSRHAQLIADEAGQWWLEDLRSTNGTFLNTAPVTGSEQLRVGDIIRIGRTQMKLEA